MKSYRTVMICFLLEIMWKDYFDIICMKGAKERLFRTDFFLRLYRAVQTFGAVKGENRWQYLKQKT